MRTGRAALIGVGGVVALVIAAMVAIGITSSGGNGSGEDRGSRPPATDAGAQSDRSISSSSSTVSTVADRAVGGADVDRDGEATLSDRTIQAGIIQREYLVMKPSWSTDDMALPLVVALHGLTVDRWKMVEIADWRSAVQRRGFIAVFPQGLGNSWNSGSCCVPSSVVGTDDVAFLDSVIAEVESSEPVDPERVFMTGFSNGGIMSYRYGCARASTLVAIAPVSGSNLEGCAPDVPLSVLHQHGDPDTVVPYEGGIGIGRLAASAAFPSVPDSVSKWSSEMGCGSDVSRDQPASGVMVMSWQGCPGGVRVELVRVEGIGHTWPKTADYDGLAEILDFFGIN